MSTSEEIAAEPRRFALAMPAAAERWAHIAWLVLFLAVFTPTLAWLVDRWTTRIWFDGHRLFIPILVGWLFWDTFRRQDGDTREPGSALGFAFLVPALLLRIFDLAIHTQVLSAFALLLALPGLALLLLGVRRTRALVFPLLLAFFMLPFPAAAVAPVHQVLREITAWATAGLIPWLGISVVRDGTTLIIPTGTVLVSDACSGFSTFYAAMTLSLILAYMASTVQRRVAILAAGAALAIGCNIVRVTGLVLMAHYGSFDLLETAAHEASGLIAFGVTLVLLLLVAGRDRRTEEPA
ncbi:MAG: exosortase/archaeosortase family protein [Deltaproteobacteria bacterium]|nr:exosortase/archaeosortase family protein [Deltaproteobacteria bacterium]MBW2412925.1 exosortase/archaeosortase family protein [Deltaproteobacteria bacterium]